MFSFVIQLPGSMMGSSLTSPEQLTLFLNGALVTVIAGAVAYWTSVFRRAQRRKFLSELKNQPSILAIATASGPFLFNEERAMHFSHQFGDFNPPVISEETLAWHRQRLLGNGIDTRLVTIEHDEIRERRRHSNGWDDVFWFALAIGAPTRTRFGSFCGMSVMNDSI